MVADFNKKGNRRLSAGAPLFKIMGIVFLVAIPLFLVADFKIYQKKKELTAEIANYQKQVQDIQKSSQTLKEEIANSNNADYLEKLGYEQFNETRPGENEIIFIQPKETKKPSVSQHNFWDVKTWSGWFAGAWGWIKGKF